MTNFITQVKESIINPSFYHGLKHRDTSYTIIYLLKLSLVISLVATFICAVLFIGFKGDLLAKAGVNKISDLGVKYLDTYFPSDLVIKMNDGVLSTNKTEPVIFPVPKDWLSTDIDDKVLDNIAVVAPQEEFTNDLFDKYKSYAIFASSTAGFFDPQKETIQTYHYKDKETGHVANLEITHDFAKEKIQTVSEYLNSILPFIFFLLAVLMFVCLSVYIFISALVFAIFTALLAWLIGKLTKSDLGYGDWYLRAIHADTLYILLAWTVAWIIPFTFIPFMNTIFVLGVLYLNKNFER